MSQKKKENKKEENLHLYNANKTCKDYRTLRHKEELHEQILFINSKKYNDEIIHVNEYMKNEEEINLTSNCLKDNLQNVKNNDDEKTYIDNEGDNISIDYTYKKKKKIWSCFPDFEKSRRLKFIRKKKKEKTKFKKIIRYLIQNYKIKNINQANHHKNNFHADVYFKNNDINQKGKNIKNTLRIRNNTKHIFIYLITHTNIVKHKNKTFSI